MSRKVNSVVYQQIQTDNDVPLLVNMYYNIIYL